MATSQIPEDVRALLRFKTGRRRAAEYRASRPRPNPSGGYTRDGVVADVVNRAALETAPWAPNTGKVFISDVYDTIVRQGADDGVSLDELKHELVRLHKHGLLELARADLVAAMPPGKVARSETDASGATYHFIVRPRQNPYVGSHPDLFGPSTHDQYQRRPGPVHDKPHTLALHLPIDPAAQRAKRAAGPESPIFVPLSDLTSEQIRELKRAQFTDQEWAELDEDDREWIEENDEESQARVDALAEVFIDRWKWEKDEDNRNLFERIEETFEYAIQEAARAGNLYTWFPKRRYDRLVLVAEQRGMGEGEVDHLLNEMLADTNNYDYTTERGYQNRHSVYEEELRGDVYVESDDWEELIADMTPDEVQRAIDKIDDDTEGDIDMDRKDLDRKYLQFEFDTGITVYATIDVDEMARRVEEYLENEEMERRGEEDQFEDPAHAPGVEERIIYRWPDGFYVLDLLPSELPAEGKAMGMCVGRPDMGYGRAVRKGEIKILSVRRPSGKPLFTIEATLVDPEMLRTRPAGAKGTPAGTITSLEQVKGKANRLPGFDLGKTAPGTPLKKDEVVRIYELIEGPGGLGEKFGLEQAVDDITDLKPAAREVNLLYRQGDKWATQLLTRLGIEEPRAVYYAGAEPGPRQNPGPACGRHGEGCTGFCAPYRRRNPAHRSSNEAMERITKERVHEALKNEKVVHREKVDVDLPGVREQWDLVTTSGTKFGGVGRAGRILIVLPRSSDLRDPLAGLAYSVEYGRPYVHHVWVDPDARGRGLSQRLFDAFREQIGELVVVGPFTTAGRAAAERAGATIEDEPA